MEADRTRSRRSSGELRELVIDGARALFSEKGYSATTTRDIADRARVAESVVFRHFRSKAELFGAAMVVPFTQLITDFTERWRAVPADEIDPEEHGRAYVTGLYRLCMGNHELLRALSNRTEGDEIDVVATTITKHVDEMVSTVQSYLDSQGATSGDLHSAIRLTMALVMGAAAFDRELFPDDVDRDALPDQLFEMALRGISYTPRTAGTGARGRVRSASRRARTGPAGR